jgi:hypothetical protein
VELDRLVPVGPVGIVVAVVGDLAVLDSAHEVAPVLGVGVIRTPASPEPVEGSLRSSTWPSSVEAKLTVRGRKSLIVTLAVRPSPS